ncbi:hypothetical protein CEXT_412351 [Caerostris extrusa]|uniref:Uncharacterized protein n=1 Tax=Caerostris extrusa TaxID=172846 RepID=A0AAV4QUN8_CAEEX|nr:hypothetical protein CEXT_412351 [Caerostris extrusa]
MQERVGFHFATTSRNLKPERIHVFLLKLIGKIFQLIDLSHPSQHKKLKCCGFAYRFTNEASEFRNSTRSSKTLKTMSLRWWFKMAATN